jgi:hypothetical protein
MSDKQILHKNIAEFITVSAEFCAFINKCEKFSRIDFIDKSIKILTLLYLKASMIDVVEDKHNDYLEKFVTEDEYNKIHAFVAEKIGSHEAYFDIVDSVGYDSSESVNVSITECFADIYQDIMNFVMLYRDFDDDERIVAVADCIANFKTFWGTRALRLISELHLIKYSDRLLETEKHSDVSESDNKSEIW